TFVPVLMHGIISGTIHWLTHVVRLDSFNYSPPRREVSHSHRLRFFRTLKEQIVHGRNYQTIDEVRDAVRDFVARYNAEWLIEKNGLRSPGDTRAAWCQAVMRSAA
ncbi:MAG: IS3 family transposase, partial [Pseudomonadota bacterium]|nr:IS3 family transposase [Pseudomonadota bacterium]